MERSLFFLRLRVTSAHFLACLAVSFLAGCLVAFCWYSLRHMQSSLGDCPSEGRADEGPCLESGSMPGRWHARGRTELAFLQGVATCAIQFDTRCPLARPSGGSPPTLAGALPPEFICGACPSSLSLAVSRLSACMCLSPESCFVLYCLHSCPPYVCVCINMNERTLGASQCRPRWRKAC
jgi:hypothetical protein